MKALIRKIVKMAFSGVMEEVRDELSANRLLMGQLLAQQKSGLGANANIQDAEFKVFSQNGEDGIIQHLLRHVPIENEVFVEFGVSDYRESNTRFLLQNDNWKGLVLDGSADNVRTIRADAIYWKHDLTAERHFITKDNINTIISAAGIGGDIGLLSVDIDGNDYWVWQAIDVVQPRIVICEFNSVFGAKHSVTVPYDESFNRRSAHHSCLFFGASLSALCALAAQKGYDFVGCDSMGVNAFFVRSDLDHGMKRTTVEDGYVESPHRESRDVAGNLTYVSGAERVALIADMEVVDVTTNSRVRLGDLA